MWNGVGAQYVQAAASYAHTVLLRSDGQAVAFGFNHCGQCDVPALPPGTQYIQAAAGAGHTVLLRSDGQAVAFGVNAKGQCDVPAPPPGTLYVQAAAGSCHTVLLRSDGQAVAIGSNRSGRCDVPALPPGTLYVQAAAGEWHTALLRSDGQAVAIGSNHDGQCDVPALQLNAEFARVASVDVPQFGSTRLIRWSPTAHGFFPAASRGLVFAMLLVRARLAQVPQNLLLEDILPFAVPRVLVHAALVPEGLQAWPDRGRRRVIGRGAGMEAWPKRRRLVGKQAPPRPY